MGHRGFGYIIALSAIVTEGRILCFILALYAFSVFAYVTATLALPSSIAILIALNLLQLPSPTDTPANSDVRQWAASHILQPLVKVALLGGTGISARFSSMR
jgi:hypothetical protein